MPKLPRTLRTIVFLIGSLLGVDTVTDVVVDEKSDMSVITQPDQSSYSSLQQFREPQSGLGTALKGLACGLLIIGSVLGERTSVAKNEEGKFDSKQVQSIGALQTQYREIRVSVPVPIGIKNSRELARGFNLVKDQMKKLIEAQIPKWIKPLNPNFSLDFEGKNNHLIVNIKVIFEVHTDQSHISHSVHCELQDIIQDLCEEKLKAILVELSKSNSVDIAEVIVPSVVRRQVFELVLGRNEATETT